MHTLYMFDFPSSLRKLELKDDAQAHDLASSSLGTPFSRSQLPIHVESKHLWIMEIQSHPVHDLSMVSIALLTHGIWRDFLEVAVFHLYKIHGGKKRQGIDWHIACVSLGFSLFLSHQCQNSLVVRCHFLRPISSRNRRPANFAFRPWFCHVFPVGKSTQGKTGSALLVYKVFICAQAELGWWP